MRDKTLEFTFSDNPGRYSQTLVAYISFVAAKQFFTYSITIAAKGTEVMTYGF